MPSDLVCAVSTDLYNSGAGCGDQYTLTYNGKSVTVRVVDLCPGCPSPGFDLSSGAFSQLADTSVGVIDCDYTKYDTLSTFQNTHPKLIRSYAHRGRWFPNSYSVLFDHIQTRMQFANSKCLVDSHMWREKPA